MTTGQRRAAPAAHRPGALGRRQRVTTSALQRAADWNASDRNPQPRVSGATQ